MVSTWDGVVPTRHPSPSPAWGQSSGGALGGVATCPRTMSLSSVGKQDSLDLHVTQHVFAVTDSRLPPGPAL